MALTKDRLIFDPADLVESDNVGAYTRAGSDGDLISSTNVGGKEGLDVNLINAAITTDTGYAEDSVAGDGDMGTFVLAQRHDANTSTVSADGDYSALHVDASGFLKVSGVDFDIRNLTFATDTIDASGSTVELGATTLAALESITVVASDLDIRDLTHVADSIKIGDGTDFLAINADGSINVNADVSVVTGSDKAEDSAHTSGDIGTFTLGVAQATLAASVSADGDYGAFKLDSRGALWTAPIGTAADDAADTETPVKIGSRSTNAALSALSAAGDRANVISDLYRRILVSDTPSIAVGTSTVSAGLTETAITALAGRTSMIIQNTSNNDVYVGATGLTTATGIRIGKGATLDLKVGEFVNMFLIAGSAANTVRILQLA